MKRVLWIVLGLAALLLLPGLIGVFLPVGHTAAARAVVPAPPAEVWSLVADLGSHPTWRDGIERVERLPDREGRPVWREVSDFGTTDVAVEEAVAERRLVTRILGDDLPYGGRWTILLEPAEGGTRVTITEQGEVYDPWFRSLSRIVFGHHGTMESYLRSLGRRFGVPEVEVERVE